MTEAELGYAAGLFDGEGSISIIRCNQCRRGRRRLTAADLDAREGARAQLMLLNRKGVA